MQTQRLIYLMLLGILVPGSILLAKDLPFYSGEELHYVLKWSIFPVGEAILNYKEQDDRAEINLSAQTNSFADTFYRVRNKSQSLTDKAMTRALYWKKSQSEGDHKREVEVKFDWEKQLVTYFNYGKPRSPIPLKPNSFDPLSIVFKTRSEALIPGETYHIPTTNGKRMMMTDIKVEGIEIIKVPCGKFEAVKLVPDTKNLGGVFKKSKDASIIFWMSNDQYHLPLRMESEVAVGSFWGELAEIKGLPTTPPSQLEGTPKKRSPIRRRK